jgi:hypothetical protein
MDNQEPSTRSSFGPKRHLSVIPKDKYKSKHMVKNSKEWQKNHMDMRHVKSCQRTFNVSDQRGNVVSQQTKEDPIRSTRTLNTLIMNSNESNHSQWSKHAGQLPTSRIESGVNPLKKHEKRTIVKDGSNPEVRCPRKFHFMKVTGPSTHQDEDIDASEGRIKPSLQVRVKEVLNRSKNNLYSIGDSNEATGRQVGVIDKNKMGHKNETHTMHDDRHKRRQMRKSMIEAPNYRSMFTGQSMQGLDCNARVNTDGRSKKREQPFQKENIFLPPKKRKYIPNNEDEDDDDDGGDQNPMIVVDDRVVEKGNLARMSMEERTTYMKTNRGEEVDDVGGNPFRIENDCEGVHRLENRLRKKRRRYVGISEDDDAEADTSGRNLVGVEDGHAEVTQVATPKDCGRPKVKFFSKHIDIPTWRCDRFLFPFLVF